MNDFISKPIVAEQLNDVLFQFLPREKVILGEKATAQDKPSAYDNSALSELATIPGIDIEAGLKSNNDEAAMYIRTLQSAYKAIPKERDKLQEDYNAKEWKNFGIRAHALKGIFATIGHKTLSEMGKELEFAAKEGRIEVCETRTAPFIAAMNDFATKLSAFQKEPDDVKKAAGSIPEIKEKIAALISACETSKSKLIKSALSELAQICVHKDIDKIRDLIEDYEYAEAAKILHSLEENV
jgi:HPt (histidine-containing phosphotransfer) domain-containing protein